MGGVIIEGRAALRFKGTIRKFEKAVVALSKLEKQIDGLKIETVPLPEKVGVSIQAKFSGSFSEFEEMIVGMEKLRASVGIDTVPLPERIAIGTWPTPERPPKSLTWIIKVSSRIKRKRKLV